MFRVMLSIFGIILLIAGGVLLFLALGPQEHKTVEVGGRTVTQEEVFQRDYADGVTSQEVLPDLPMTVDGVESSTNQVSAVPEMSSDAVQDMTTIQSAEQIDTQQIDGPVTVEEVPITEDLEVETIPLDLSTASVASVSDLSGQGGAGEMSGVYEQRVVELEYPQYFKVKGNANIRLTLRALPSGEIAAVPEIADNALLATPILLSDLYDTHIPFFTAELIAPTMKKIQMMTPQVQSAQRGEDLTWRWNVQSPDKSQTADLIFTLTIRWEPRSAGSTVSQRVIWSQAIKVDVNYVFGPLTVPQASMAGMALAAVGLVAEIPTGTAMLTWLLTRPRRNRRAPRRDTRRRR